MQAVLERELVRAAPARFAASRRLDAGHAAGRFRAVADARLVEVGRKTETHRIGEHLVEKAQHVDPDEIALHRVQALLEGRVVGDRGRAAIGGELCASAIGREVGALGKIAQLRQRRQHDVARAGIDQRLHDLRTERRGLDRIVDVTDVVARDQRVVQRVGAHRECSGCQARQETGLLDAKAAGGNHRVAGHGGQDLLGTVTADREIEVVRVHRVGARQEHQWCRGIHAPEAEVEGQPFRHRQAAQPRRRVDVGESQPGGTAQLEVGKLPRVVVAGTEGDELAERHAGRCACGRQRRRCDCCPDESPHALLLRCTLIMYPLPDPVYAPGARTDAPHHSHKQNTATTRAARHAVADVPCGALREDHRCA
ncbi:MAG: hypothetical protein IPO20_22035 [Gammaproteobacteria bacterium]|nr:hypothetical protein [Gammaproteobacteria bacterium]